MTKKQREDEVEVLDFEDPNQLKLEEYDISQINSFRQQLEQINDYETMFNQTSNID